MWIQVRSMDGKKVIRLDGLSKLTKVDDLRTMLMSHFDCQKENQKLFYRGKIMVDGHTLFDYNVGLNDIVQILVQKVLPTTSTEPKETQSDNLNGTTNNEFDNDKEDLNNGNDAANPDKGEHLTNGLNGVCNGEKSEAARDVENDTPDEAGTSATFKLGDVIDARDETMGAWFEADLLRIEKAAVTNGHSAAVGAADDKGVDSNDNVKVKSAQDYPDGYCYYVNFEGYEDDEGVVPLSASNIRPRARHKVSLEEVKVGDKVMINYNYDEPLARGYWYDAVVTAKRCTRTIKQLTCTVYIGKDLVPFEGCEVVFWWEIFRIEEMGTQLNKLSGGTDAENLYNSKREVKPECDHCRDKPNKKCKHCSCRVCGEKKDPDKQIMCDECDDAFHLWCLNPPLEALPESDEWYCPACRNDASEVVQAGEKLKESKKKAKMASATGNSSRDWGKGMACVGRSKVCSIVPPNHFGPIPGVEIGMMWKFRVQVSEAGVHRPHVAGIHGREDEGAYSIVLSGGYEDDTDNGDEFFYTGSGGRDLSGNKRTAGQSCDQQLTRMNRALAKNCAAPIDNKKGAQASNWQAGKPVRVVRNYKGCAHSKYAPEDGNRYDGIYKIVKYWPEKGKSGFIVWRFLLRRDDPVPAPWTKEGKKRAEKLGLTMLYPEGYVENQQQSQEDTGAAEESGEKTPKQKRGRKRKRMEEDDEENDAEEQPPQKQAAVVQFKIDKNVAKMMTADEINKNLWEEVKAAAKEGYQKYIGKVEELFMCICCQDTVFQPVTTSCNHNLCKPCLQRSFKAQVFSCPACRTALDKEDKLAVNNNLRDLLCAIFPAYETGR